MIMLRKVLTFYQFERPNYFDDSNKIIFKSITKDSQVCQKQILRNLATNLVGKNINLIHRI